ncbi:MAG: hypothetical protein HY519_02155 [Candidatus Aenigmarchaeota archaeon]|nr:hypothetical protein [Candidatus Aenigmarchaeota archaeon]
MTGKKTAKKRVHKRHAAHHRGRQLAPRHAHPGYQEVRDSDFYTPQAHRARAAAAAWLRRKKHHAVRQNGHTAHAKQEQHVHRSLPSVPAKPALPAHGHGSGMHRASPVPSTGRAKHATQHRASRKPAKQGLGAGRLKLGRLLAFFRRRHKQALPAAAASQPPRLPNAPPANYLETEVDRLYQLVRERKSIPIEMAASEFHVNTQKIEEWGRILEEHGMIELHYPAFGKAQLRAKAQA